MNANNSIAQATAYKDIVYRSKTEAIWAAFLDKMNVEFKYEPKMFEFDSSCLQYIPDFWLPSQKIWVEIKGDSPTLKEHQKAALLFRHTGNPVYTFTGIPEIKLCMNLYDNNYSYEMCNFEISLINNNSMEMSLRFIINNLSTTMLFILGGLKRNMTIDCYKNNIAKMSHIMIQSIALMSGFRSIQDLTKESLVRYKQSQSKNGFVKNRTINIANLRLNI